MPTEREILIEKAIEDYRKEHPTGNRESVTCHGCYFAIGLKPGVGSPPEVIAPYCKGLSSSEKTVLKGEGCILEESLEYVLG